MRFTPEKIVTKAPIESPWETWQTTDKAEIDCVSVKVEAAVRKVLSLSLTDKLFIGNEEKMFSFCLLQQKNRCDERDLPETPPNTFFEVYQNVFFQLVGKRASIKTKAAEARFKENAIGYLRSLKALIRRTFSVGKSKSQDELCRVKALLSGGHALIHFGASLRSSSHVLPNISEIFFRYPQSNRHLRDRLNEELLDQLTDEKFARTIAQLFPVSHLEAYWEIRKHLLAGTETSVVCSSILGVMNDPLLGAIVHQNRAKLVYVQHGGGYGLMASAAHQIEANGPDEMLWWGVGETNVFPTRFPDDVRSVCTDQSFILLGNASETALSEWCDACEKLRSVGTSCVVCTHPKFEVSNSQWTQVGIKPSQHKTAGLVVYDTMLHTAIFERILAKLPFLVAESDDVEPQHLNAENVMDMMRACEILLPKSRIVDTAQGWIKIPTKRRIARFREQAKPLLEYFDQLPRLEELYPPYRP